MTRPTTRPPTQRPLVAIYRDEYHTLFAEKDSSLLCVIRSPVQFTTTTAIEETFAGLSAAMDKVGRRDRVLLMDLRQVQGNNDPTFETTILRHLALIEKGFLRIGTLLRTPAGVLQVKRMAGHDDIERIVSLDEREVFDFLRNGPKRTMPPRPPPPPE